MTLPTDCRPNKRVIFNLNNHQNTLRVDVLTNGQVHYVSGTWLHGWLNLDGIQFAVANQKALATHSGWVGYGHGYGSPTYTKKMLCVRSRVWSVAAIGATTWWCCLQTAVPRSV